MTNGTTRAAGGASARERLAKKKQEQGTAAGKHLTLWQKGRGLLDALVFAFVLAMFIRSFVFELYMIPTGSMTPTLIGDMAGEVAVFDYDGDGVDDFIYTFASRGGYSDTVQVYLMNEDGTYKNQIFLYGVPPTTVRDLARSSSRRKDMIIVNKFAYWFRQPNLGEISVFKVPHRPDVFEEAENGTRRRVQGIRFETDKPVYIKRVVGLPGDTVSFLPVEIVERPPGHGQRYGTALGGTEIHLRPHPILVNGEPLTNGPFEYLIHYPRPSHPGPGFPIPQDPPNTRVVPPDGVLLVGDNSASSSDGRYWGHVPMNHLRGKAILRYLPLQDFGFLK